MREVMYYFYPGHNINDFLQRSKRNKYKVKDGSVPTRKEADEQLSQENKNITNAEILASSVHEEKAWWTMKFIKLQNNYALE